MIRKKKQHNNQYKSKFELTVASLLGDKVSYEPDSIRFIQPAKGRIYKPDFKLAENIYIETKGKWVAADRQKHLWVKEQHPEITIYILFQNSNQKLSKISKTTYGEWATKNGLQWSDFKWGIPKEWLEHASNSSNRVRRGASDIHRRPSARRTKVRD